MCRGLGVLLLLLVRVVAVVAVEVESKCLHPHIKQRCSVRDPLMDPTYEVHDGHDVVWQIPPNPKGILFLAHGGFKDPLSFFDRGPKCEPCYGLPEDRAVVLEALHRGYAVIAIKSSGVGYDVFPIETSTDLVIVPSIIKQWTMEYSLHSLPLFAWGHSAGGYFVSVLPLKLHIRALVFMCSTVLKEMDDAAIPDQYPPSFFAYMPVDKDNANLNITEAMAILRERGVEVAEKQCWPKPLSPLFFTERIRCLSNQTSREIYRAYKAAGWLDTNNYLTKNPTSNDWESVLWKAKAVSYCEESRSLCFASHILQELQMAYAEHSLTSDANEQIFPWLESKMLLSTEHTATLSHVQ